MLKVKRNERGEIERYKARLVAKGFLKKEGRNYKKTFAPVMQTALLRSMLVLATKHDWEIEHVDIKPAFLYGEIDCELYIQLPDRSCRLLHKGIYGLKQAGRLWNKKFNATLISLGFLRCENDPCCYVLKDKSMIVMVHVDDCIILGPDKKRIQQFKTGLENEYEIKDLGPMKFPLQWEIVRDRKNRTLTINQKRMVIDMLELYGMTKCRPVSTPTFQNVVYSKAQCPKNDAELKAMKEVPYLQALGSLIYLATCTRPDISYASELSKKASNPGETHWEGIKRVMIYLRGTSSYGISYGHTPTAANLVGYADASYAKCVDTRRSRYGGIYLFNGGPVEWKSKLTRTVALSSMEAEYIGACEFARIGVWLRRSLDEVGFPQAEATPLGCDNKSAIIFGNDAIVQNRSRHIDTRYHYIREVINENKVALFYQPTSEIPADILTKPLGVGAFKKCRATMGIFEVSRNRD